MRTSSLFAAAFIAALGSATAFGQIVAGAASSGTWPAPHAGGSNAPFGTPAQSSAADRRIFIEPTTRHINVNHGETILFVAGNQSFAWTFDTPDGSRPIPLAKIAPPGSVPAQATVYVSWWNLADQP